MTVCLRCALLKKVKEVKDFGEGVRTSVSSASARGNGEGEVGACGVAGINWPAGIYFINNPGNIREGMRADVLIDGPL